MHQLLADIFGSDLVNIGTGAFAELFHSSTLLVFAASIAFGYALKALPQIPNRTVPSIVGFFSAILMWLVGNPKDIAVDQAHPNVVFAAVGFIIGMASWAMHGIILAALEKRLGILQDNSTSTPPKQNEK